MAAPLKPGLTPAEVAFVAELELITVIPRQKLEGLKLLSGTTPSLQPPRAANLPLWLALLLKRQGRANISPPPWLSVDSLTTILTAETAGETFTPAPDLPAGRGSRSLLDPLPAPPFISSCIATADRLRLPYHWLSVATLVLNAAADDVPDAEGVRRLLRDLREARAAKLRAGIEVLEGARQVRMDGIGGLEIASEGALIRGVVDGLKKIGSSKEASRKEREERDGPGGMDEEEDI